MDVGRAYLKPKEHDKSCRDSRPINAEESVIGRLCEREASLVININSVMIWTTNTV